MRMHQAAVDFREADRDTRQEYTFTSENQFCVTVSETAQSPARILIGCALSYDYPGGELVGTTISKPGGNVSLLQHGGDERNPLSGRGAWADSHPSKQRLFGPVSEVSLLRRLDALPYCPDALVPV